MNFRIHDIVMINELKLPGRIKRVQLEESGILYEVRYFWNAEPKNVWFYEEELTFKDNIKMHMEFIKPHPLGEIKCIDVWHYEDAATYARNHNGLCPRSCPACGAFWNGGM